ncbi:RcpC/CpaB family pilus assembly protein [Actinomyces sp. MRS3W]|uniref:RcpC/CpaB family pilus assembly protein n=1 Tax=Actinomyces sp. MRS3W TaxID=2800796 RepID=UPI0028FD3CD5|nr:RcpC/CpaB family pilus assembly protein [Actinomyces sp. MRS3W]MDU0348422.1 RcpC/CpaB family pilus assembly protein [Actinomyces sp. MRS3W]
MSLLHRHANRNRRTKSSPRSGQRRLPRPSLLLWRQRHLVVAVCLGAAVMAALGVLRPAPEGMQEVVVIARPVNAGAVLTDADIEVRAVPQSALPAEGLADSDVVGSRAAITLEEGTVLTTSMTSASLAATLTPAERLVQVPINVGAELAEPGARVDIVAERSAATTGTDAGSAAVICSGARVVLTQEEGENSGWISQTKVTLVTLAVPAVDASLIVGAATNGALGIVLSP